MRASVVSTCVLAMLVAGCEQPLDPDQFQRSVERVFGEVNPGFAVAKRLGSQSRMVRGDQLITLETEPLFVDYVGSKQAGSAWLATYRERLEAEAKGRRRPLDRAASVVRPFLKGGAWVRGQDMGAIGPANVVDKLRPWRQPVADDVFAVLAISETLLGYRIVSQAEVATSTTPAARWLERATRNLVAEVDTSSGAVELRSSDGRLLVLDLPNVDGVAGLVLDRGFRERMIHRFGLSSVGAAAPCRDVLILFDPDDVSTRRPVRARAHELHDNRNHPGFRGLLRLSPEGISQLEAAYPEQKTGPKPGE